MIFKLISPIRVAQTNWNSEENDEYIKELNDNSTELYYAILGILNEDRFSGYPSSGELSQGLMYWYDDGGDDEPIVNGIQGDVVKRTITFAFPTVEIIDGKIMGVCYCNFEPKNRTEEEIANFEPNIHQDLLDKLIDYVSGQYSDGWGEGLEQKFFKYQNEDTYVSFWQYDNWAIEVDGFEVKGPENRDSKTSILKELLEKCKTDNDTECAKIVEKIIFLQKQIDSMENKK